MELSTVLKSSWRKVDSLMASWSLEVPLEDSGSQVRDAGPIQCWPPCQMFVTASSSAATHGLCGHCPGCRGDRGAALAATCPHRAWTLPSSQPFPFQPCLPSQLRPAKLHWEFLQAAPPLELCTPFFSRAPSFTPGCLRSPQT